METTCYFCGAPSTSKEHVPPKGIFPKPKDVPGGIDYRANLITVPSCDLHNSDKSEDDTYLMMVMVSYFQNNVAAQNQIKSTVTRAWAKDKKLAHRVVKNLQKVNVLGTEQYAFEVDIERFDRSLSLIAHGLHFYELGMRAPNPYHAISYPLIKLEGSEANDVNSGRASILRLSAELFDGAPRKGENPEIFWYQSSPPLEGRYIIRMCFYEAFQVIALSSTSVDAAQQPHAAIGSR